MVYDDSQGSYVEQVDYSEHYWNELFEGYILHIS